MIASTICTEVTLDSLHFVNPPISAEAKLGVIDTKMAMIIGIILKRFIFKKEKLENLSLVKNFIVIKTCHSLYIS